MKTGNRKSEIGKSHHPLTARQKIAIPSSFPKRGAALLIALTFLVLLSAVVLALFATTRTTRATV